VRGGAIPLLAWGTLLLVLLLGNWVWTQDTIQVGLFAMATGIIYATAALFIALNRQAVRRGPPTPASEPEAIPAASLAAVLVGLSIACIGFGLVWAGFLIYFGAGILVLSLGRLVLELRAELRAVETLGEPPR
jgi:small neutral amino acid transporter SnatA (MarC family)